jgi:ribosomal protein L35
MTLRDLLRIPGHKVRLRWSETGTIYRREDAHRHQLTKAQKKRMRRTRTRARLLANGRLS